MNQQSAVLSQLSSDFSAYTGAGAYWNYTGTSNGSQVSGIFNSAVGSTSGTLTFAHAVYGVFAIALKASNQFSMYLFNGGTTGITSVAFITNGTSLNQAGIAQGLSHASMYTASGVSVTTTPEPATYLLVISGLGAMAFVKRRRA